MKLSVFQLISLLVVFLILSGQINGDDQGVGGQKTNSAPPTAATPGSGSVERTPSGETGSAHGPNWDSHWGWGSTPEGGWGYGSGSGHSPDRRSGGFGFGWGSGSGGSGSGGGGAGGGGGYGFGGGNDPNDRDGATNWASFANGFGGGSDVDGTDNGSNPTADPNEG
ncbi:OLC1v1027082C1 [Oldenlandia corymbosa var. corymbosa]|uniref:OLC1v1027082C1 n=1 Tax=Oldenlandia corymbosa var. corymbosa TaxID=529605 RepID=A0AAV1CAF7_OLDCO|nr:OLC1v1027082C1 [Oldenlandia corymbosa var. corymbosa]